MVVPVVPGAPSLDHQALVKEQKDPPPQIAWKVVIDLIYSPRSEDVAGGPGH